MFSSASRDLSLLPGPTGQKLLIMLQGVMSSLTFITALSAVSYMPVPDALCIVFSCPVVTIILSALVLKVMDVNVMMAISDKFPLRIDLAPARSLPPSCSSLVWCSCVSLLSCSTRSHTKRECL